jgi:hypothetical protein
MADAASHDVHDDSEEHHADVEDDRNDKEPTPELAA